MADMCSVWVAPIMDTEARNEFLAGFVNLCDNEWRNEDCAFLVLF